MGGYESDDESPFQSAIEESLRERAAEAKATGTGAKADASKKPVAPSKFGTVSGLQKDDDSSEEEGTCVRPRSLLIVRMFCLGQAFYAGGSERSGQQILGPSKGKGNDQKVTKIFEAARKLGAMEADEDNEGASSQTKREKAFAGTGYTLGTLSSLLDSSSTE